MYQNETEYSKIKARIQELGKSSIREADFEGDKVMMITINWTLQNRSIYNAVRFSWKVSRMRAEKALYVLAVFQGIVIDVFQVDHLGWRVASITHFPEFGSDDVDRFAFSGDRADEAVLKRYCWKRIQASYRPKGCANPILYNYQ
jgi:hypothetical protein